MLRSPDLPGPGASGRRDSHGERLVLLRVNSVRDPESMTRAPFFIWPKLLRTYQGFRSVLFLSVHCSFTGLRRKPQVTQIRGGTSLRHTDMH